jgi:hypothetical protein
MCAFQRMPLGGVQSPTGVPPTQDSTAPTGTWPFMLVNNRVAVRRQTADMPPALVALAVTHWVVGVYIDSFLDVRQCPFPAPPFGPEPDWK